MAQNQINVNLEPNFKSKKLTQNRKLAFLGQSITNFKRTLLKCFYAVMIKDFLTISFLKRKFSILSKLQFN